MPVQTRVSILNLDDERPSIISTTNISIEDLVHESAGGGALEPDVVAAPRGEGQTGDEKEPGEANEKVAGRQWWRSLLCGCGLTR